MSRLQDFYKSKVAPDLQAKFGYESQMEVPRITKITLNMGVSEAVADKKVIEHAVSDLTKIAGQKPVVTKTRTAIAGFKIREEYPIRCMVTLRGQSMRSGERRGGKESVRTWRSRWEQNNKKKKQ